MIVSTRGRYALRVMIDMAEQGGDAYIPMQDIAARQGVSPKYMEQIMPALVKEHLVTGIHGKGGGYRLAVDPAECSVLSILQATEGSLCSVTCLESGANTCERAKTCQTLPVWKKLNSLIEDYLGGVFLSDLCRKPS